MHEHSYRARDERRLLADVWKAAGRRWCAGAQVTGSHHGHTAHSWVLRVLHKAVRVGQAFDKGYALRRVEVTAASA